jgi:hypothetical protein
MSTNRQSTKSNSTKSSSAKSNSTKSSSAKSNIAKSNSAKSKSKQLATNLVNGNDTRENLIQRDKYFKFIDITHKHEIEDRNCLVEMLKNYYIHFNHRYPNIKSNKQF